jgi:hypothetical protein
MQGLLANILMLNTVISLYIYTVNGKDWIYYYIISAVISTIAGLNADYHTYWGLLSLSKADYFLREKKLFKSRIYYIFMIVLLLLSILWTISFLSNFIQEINKFYIYLIFIISYAEFVRRGIWVFFRIED